MEQGFFDISSFSFASDQTSRRRKVSDGTTLVIDNRTDGRPVCKLSMSGKVTELVTGIFGDRCDVGLNGRGDILLMAGSARKITRNSTSGRCRSYISLDTFRDELISRYGRDGIELEVAWYDETTRQVIIWDKRLRDKLA